MNDLDRYRQEIDSIDDKLVELFEKRMNVSIKVAQYKKNNSSPVLHSDREQQVIDRAVNNLSNKDFAVYTQKFMCDLMSVSKELQNDYIASETDNTIKVGYQGIEGSFSHQAAKKYFGKSVNLSAYSEFEDVFTALDKGEITAGILPIENSNSGSVGQVYDLLCKYGFYICGEQFLRVNQFLLGNDGCSLNTIKEVYSHAQGISQCSKFLSKYPHWKLIPYSNTAVSAKLVADKQDPTIAAIASEDAAELYSLKVLEGPINNNPDNTTRFIVISKHFNYENANKISIVCSLDDKAGTLYNLLSYFAYHNINMVKIESRPMSGHKWKYFLYVDFEGDFESEQIKLALQLIEKSSGFFKILGAYKADGGESANA